MALDYTQLNPVEQAQWFKERIIIDNDIAISTGAGAGKILTSDADGNATWETSGASGGDVFVLGQTTTDSAITGSAGTEVSFNRSILVPANTLTTGDIFYVYVRLRRTNANNNIVPRIRIHTSDAIAGTIVAQLTMNNTIFTLGGNKDFAIKSATNTETQGAASWGFPVGLTAGASTSYNIDWTVDQYVIITSQNTSGADISTLSYYSLFILKG